MMVELVLRLPIEAKTEAEAKRKFANQVKSTIQLVDIDEIMKITEVVK